MAISDSLTRRWRTARSARLVPPTVTVPGQGVPVTATETLGLRNEGVLLVDVREPREWSAGHVLGSRNMPIDVVDPALLPSGLPVVLLCRNGHRARLAARILTSLGMDASEVFVLAGGLEQWDGAASPLVDRDEAMGRLV